MAFFLGRFSTGKAIDGVWFAGWMFIALILLGQSTFALEVWRHKCDE